MMWRNALLGVFVFLLTLGIVFPAEILLTVKDPEGKLLDNTTVKVFGKDFYKEFKTDANGTVTLNLTDGKDYILVVEGDNYVIVGLILNATDNTTKTLNASAYNVTKINVSPKDLQVKTELQYEDVDDVKANFTVPTNLYIEPAKDNVTLTFQNSIIKGASKFVFKEVKVDNETLTENKVTIKTAKDHKITVTYIQTINPLVLLAVIFIIIILVALLLTGKKQTARKLLRTETKYFKRK